MLKHVKYLLPYFALLWGGINISSAAVFPPDCAILHFTQIMLEWHPVQYADHYRIQLTDDASGKMTSYLSEIPCLLLPDLLSFGHAYTWKVEPVYQGLPSGKIQQYQFSIGTSNRVDTTLYVNLSGRLVPGKDAGGIIFLDNPGVAYNRALQPVWFYPDTSVYRFFTLRQLDDGRISGLMPKSRTHVNNDLDFRILAPYSDSIFWQAPDDGQVSGDSSEHYHHDYQVLPNDHILILGNEYVMKYNGFRDYPVTYGTVIEYDTSGKAVWEWKASEYFTDEQLFMNGPVSNPTHMNAVFQESDGKHIWVSFRNIHQVIKIEKFTGKVVARIGSPFPGSGPSSGNGLFHAMHSPLIGADEYMYLYDNGTGQDGDTVSSAMCLDISQIPNSVTVRWEYFCRYGNILNSFSEAKGNVQPLPNGNVLINMGSVPTTLEVTPEGQVVWEAFHRIRQHNLYADTLIWVPDNFRAFWTQSLYPQWMTTYPVWKGTVLYSLNIANAGHLPDTYQINLLDKSGKVVKTISHLPQVMPGKQLEVEALRKIPRRVVAIHVQSSINPGFSRTLYLP